MSGWVKMDGIANYPRLFSRKSNYTDNDGWEIEMSQSYTAFAARGRNNTTCSGSFPQTLENNWAHVALIYNDSTLSVYQNGVLVKSASIDNATDNALQLSIGCNSNGSETYIQGAFDECRLLDAVAPPDWLKAEYGTVHAPDFLSYGAAELMMSGGTLLVMGSPSKIGSPTPPYGSTENLASNQTVTLSMPATMVAGAGSVTNYLVGWKIESIDLETGAAELLRTSADANEVVDSCLYTHSGAAVFTWLWDVRDKPGVGAPTLVSNDGVSLALSAEVTGAGYTGTPATLKFAYGLSPDNLAATGTVSTAVVSPGTVTGTIGGLTSGNYYYVRAVLESDAGTIASPIVSFPAGTPNLLHVSTLGDDSAGNGSPLTPYATIAKALARAGEGCEIRVAGGLYVEDLVSTVSDVTVSGSWLDDFSTRDLRNHRTVIKATASSKDCYTVSGSVTTSNTLCGVDLTGGRYGFNLEGRNQRETTTRDTLYQCVVSNCTIGVYAYNRGEGLALLSCLLADNAEDGVFARNDTGGPGWYYNCTFVRNGRSGAHRAHPYCMDRQHRNCVFVDNASAFYTEHGFSGNAGRAYFENVLWFGNGQNIYHAAGALDSFDGGMAFTGVQLRADPKLGPDYTPAAGSPCIGAGKDFSADATVPFDADLYGTPWGGSWGLGCVKGIGQANAKFADVYVSPNGSDSNDGASASTAKASIGEALAVLADGGTCHVANGTYTEGVFLSVTNATLLGESRDGVHRDAPGLRRRHPERRHHGEERDPAQRPGGRLPPVHEADARQLGRKLPDHGQRRRALHFAS